MAKKDQKQEQKKEPKWTAKDELLALSLAQGVTLREAAERHKISMTTAYRRTADPEFMARVACIQEEFVATGYARLANGFGAAVQKMLDLMENGDSHAVQLNAAKAVVEAMLKVRDNVTLAARMAEIERELGIGVADGKPPQAA